MSDTAITDLRSAKEAAKAAKETARAKRVAIVAERRAAAAAAELNAPTELRKLAAELQANSAVLSGLEKMMSARLGAKVRHVRSDTVMPPRTRLTPYLKVRKTHTKHWLSVSGRIDPAAWPGLTSNGEIIVFLKCSLNSVFSEFDAVLNEMQARKFRSPYFFGAFHAGGLNVGVWEFVEGTRTPFEQLPLDTQLKLVRAVAGLNAIPIKDGVAIKTKWASTPLNWYLKTYGVMQPAEQEQWQGALAGVTDILSDHEAVDGHLRSFGEPLLAHNDINPNNVFTPETGDVIIFDWEAALRSVPGADLRFLYRLDAKDALLSAYVEQMAEFGISLEADKVRAAYEVVEGFRLVNKGWANRNISAVQTGLNILRERLPPGGASTAGASDTTGRQNAAAASATVAPTDTAASPSAVSQTSTVRPSVAREENMVVLTERNEQPAGQVQASGTSPRTPSPELMNKVQEYVDLKGSLYAPIAHPAFAAFPYKWSPERFEKIKPHLEFQGGTALDIGSHWGYIAHRLEDMGYDVTANEYSRRHIYYLNQIKELCGKKFKVVYGSVFDMTDLNFDVVIALNIFHHFLKTEEVFQQFEAFLARLKCRMVIYQAHRPSERPKLDGAGHYMEPRDMAKFLADRLSLSQITTIGSDTGREVFKLKA